MTKEELEIRIKNMLRVSDYMLGRVVREVMKDESTDLYYDIMAECQCRNLDGTLNYNNEVKGKR